MILAFLLSTALAKPACYSLKDLRSAVCHALCKADGNDLGSYEERSHSCICGQRKDFKEITKGAVKILPPIIAGEREPKVPALDIDAPAYSPFGGMDEE